MKYFTTQRKFYSTKGQKELINKIHKYNINTVTMVTYIKLGISRSLW